WIAPMNEDRGLDQNATQRVLERALDLDVAAEEELTPAQIRAIAAELGVSPGAIEKALVEHASQPAVTAPTPRSVRRPSQRLARASMVVAISVVVYVLLAVVVRLVS